MRLLRRIPRWAWLLLVLVVLIPPPVVSMLEERDTFCIACHTVPENTYFDRAQHAGEGAQDLASAHYTLETMPFRCIDCHRGDGSLGHRAQTLALGAKDTLIWLAGRSDPAIEKKTTGAPELVQSSCLTCHTDTLLVAGFNNHFHNLLPQAYAAWQAGGQLVAPPEIPNANTDHLEQMLTAVNCLDCHQAHVHAPGSELFYFLDIRGAVYPACVQCHLDVGRGPQKVEQLGG